MVINHNLSASRVHRHLGIRDREMEISFGKLSSGLRIQRSADDPTGLAVSEKMRAQIRGLHQAERNIQDGISFLQTVEGYMENTGNLLHRMRELAVQAANDTYEVEDRQSAQTEINLLIDEIDRIASQAQFNGHLLLDGTWGESGMGVQVGANIDQREIVNIASLDSEGLGLAAKDDSTSGTELMTSEDAAMLINRLDGALNLVNTERSSVCAYHNRFTLAKDSVALSAENLQASESRIRDLDMAAEAVSLMKKNILSQAGIAMLAQANNNSQAVLRLIS